jgi:hypothetical protein
LPFDSDALAASPTVARMFTSRSTTRLAAMSVAVGLSIGAAACGGSDEQAASTSGAAATAAATPSGPPKAVYGTYERRVTRADLERTASIRDESGPNQELPLAGIYRLTIARGTSQDALKATDPEQFVVGMDVALDASGGLRATSYIDPAQGAFCGPQIPAPADYSYVARGGQLELHAKKDPCADRDSILTGVWKRT